MNKTITYLFLICFISIDVYPQGWIRQESNINEILTDVQFINSDIGFVVGHSGVILKTVDGGSHWDFTSSGVITDLFSVCFPDSAIGFAISESQLLKTTDCGESWFVQDTVIGAKLAEIHFIGEDTGFVVGNRRMLMTTDKGTSWIKKKSADVGYVNSFWATDSKNLFVGGTDFLIVKSTDGGETWDVSHDYSGVGEWESMFFTGITEGYAIGGGSAHGTSWGAIIKTTNRGEDWSASTYSEEGPYFNSVFFINNKIGYVVGDGGRILKTNDAGASWINLNNNEPENLYSVFFTDSITGYAVGANGTILKTINGGINYSTTPVYGSSLSFHPNPTHEILYIKLNNLSIQNSEISIYSITGRLAKKFLVGGNNISLNLFDLQSGIYIVNITNNEQTYSFKFQKQ